MNQYNETDTIEVNYRCPKCFATVKNTFKYFSGFTSEKMAKQLAKKEICKKCKGE